MSSLPHVRPADRLGAVLPFVLLSLGIAPRTVSQCTPPLSGPGSESFVTVLDSLTGLSNHRGVTYIGGEIFVTGVDPMTGQRTVVAFDPITLVARSLPSLTGLGTGGFPIDWHLCTTDGVHLILLGTSTAGIEVHYVDIDGNPVTTIQATGGPQTVPSAIVITTNLGSPSGMAFDPDANGELGAVCTIANFSGSLNGVISCLDLDGNLVETTELAPFVSGSPANGLAVDPLRDRLWSNRSFGGTALDDVEEYYQDFESPAPPSQLPTSRTICAEFVSTSLAFVEVSPFGGPGTSELLVVKPFASALGEDLLSAYRAPHFPEPIGDGCGSPPMELTTTLALNDGSTVTFTMTNVPPPQSSAVLFSTSQIPGGLPMDFVGAIGCSLYVGPVAGTFGLSPTSPATTTFGVGPGLNGLDLTWQGAALAPGVNPLNVVTSNAVLWSLP